MLVNATEIHTRAAVHLNTVSSDTPTELQRAHIDEFLTQYLDDVRSVRLPSINLTLNLTAVQGAIGREGFRWGAPEVIAIGKDAGGTDEYPIYAQCILTTSKDDGKTHCDIIIYCTVTLTAYILTSADGDVSTKKAAKRKVDRGHMSPITADEIVPYLVKKGLSEIDFSYIPVMRSDYKKSLILQYVRLKKTEDGPQFVNSTVQTITEKSKRFAHKEEVDAKRSFLCLYPNSPDELITAEFIFIVEGVATGLTVLLSLQEGGFPMSYAVVCAGSAGGISLMIEDILPLCDAQSTFVHCGEYDKNKASIKAEARTRKIAKSAGFNYIGVYPAEITMSDFNDMYLELSLSDVYTTLISGILS